MGGAVGAGPGSADFPLDAAMTSLGQHNIEDRDIFYFFIGLYVHSTNEYTVLLDSAYMVNIFYAHVNLFFKQFNIYLGFPV